MKSSSNDITYVHGDGSAETIPMYDYTVSYTAPDGQKKTAVRWGKTDEYSIGQTLEFKYDARYECEDFYPDDYRMFVILFAVSGASLTIACRKALSGYKRDFIRRYPKACGFTVITAFIPVIYHNTAYLHPAPSWIMEGLAEALTLIALLIAVPVVNIIVWIAAAVMYYRKTKKKNSDGVDENGTVAK